MPNTTAGPGVSGKTCPYCQTPIKPNVPVYVCDRCGIPHHQECWEYNGGCTTFGCAGAGTAGVPTGSQHRAVPSPPAYSQQPQQYSQPYQPQYQQPQYGVRPVQFKDYLTESILVTLFCCLPLGIVAIVYASQARSKMSVGDYAGAQKAAGTAKLFVTLSLCLLLGYIVVMFLANLGSGGY